MSTSWNSTRSSVGPSLYRDKQAAGCGPADAKAARHAGQRYSWGAIAAWLSEHGLAVSRSVLQGYLRSSSSAATGTSARARKGRQKRVEEQSAGISTLIAPAHPPVVATPPVKRKAPAAKPTAKEAVGRPIEHGARRSEFAVRPDSEEL
jgi:hypothetical protein